jgi:1,2-dihydroxy-3-keto-5-methylthiopentene dioxygenase
MSTLFVYSEDSPEEPGEVVRDEAGIPAIASVTARIGVRLERWKADRELPEGASQDDILTAYGTEIARLKAECGYRSADVVRIARGTPDTAPMRQKFLAEHRHGEDEVRFFVEGSGTFYFHAESKVYVLLCTRGDLVGVPAGTRHWFDMGEAPYFCAVRLFVAPDGWVASFTGDLIASRFLTHDAAVARSAAA